MFKITYRYQISENAPIHLTEGDPTCGARSASSRTPGPSLHDLKGEQLQNTPTTNAALGRTTLAALQPQPGRSRSF